MTLDLSKYGPGLKAYYSNQKIENMTYKDYPFFAMLQKVKTFGGKNLPLPIQIGNPQNRSHTFSKAIAGNKSSTLKDFTLLRSKDYSIARIDAETAEASESNQGAFQKALVLEIDSAIRSASTSLAGKLFGDGSGAIGKIGAATNVATTSLFLAEPDDVVNYEVGMSVVIAEFKSVGGLRGAGTPNEIVSVNRVTGELTMLLPINTATGAAVGDYIFADGDRGLSIKGLDAWFPSVSPLPGDNFFGVDRSVDPTRLAGVRFDGSALSIEEALVKGLTLANREGGSPKVVFMNYTDWSNLELALGSKVQYITSQAFSRADIGFSGIQIKTNKGVANCIADPFCAKGKAYGLTMETLALYSLKEPVRILDLDGNKLLRSGTEDSVELRVGGYYQLGCKAPGHNVVITL